MQGREVYVVDAVRTPIGRHGGALAGVRPDDLGAVVIEALLERNSSLDPARIGEVTFGAANQSGEDNRNVARMSSLLAGLPTSVPGSTINRLCASGLDAVVSAARTIAVGDASIMVAGGVESMTRAPYVLPKSGRPYPSGNATVYSTTLGWRMVNPNMPDEWTVSLGESTELLGEKYGITREQADEFAVRSQQKAAAAWEAGAYDAAIVQVPDAEMPRDEGIREGVTAESLASLKPSFRPDGTVTAGNASQLSDGAAALLLVDEDGLAELGAEPLARITATGVRRRRPAVLRHRAGRGREPGAREGGPISLRRDRDGAERGVRRAVARLPLGVALARPRRGQPARRRNSHRSPARAARVPASPAPSPTSSPRPAPVSGSPLSASAWVRASL